MRFREQAERKAGSRNIISTDRTALSYLRDLFPEHSNIRELMGFLQEKTTLDMGSGASPYRPDSFAAKAKEYGVHVVSMDISESQKMFFVRNARLLSKVFGLPAHTGPGTSVVADAVSLPFKDESFHQIISSWSFPYYMESHREFTRRILSEIYRTLRVGGEIRLTPYNGFPSKEDLVDAGFSIKASTLNETMLLIPVKEGLLILEKS